MRFVRMIVGMVLVGCLAAPACADKDGSNGDGAVGTNGASGTGTGGADGTGTGGADGTPDDSEAGDLTLGYQLGDALSTCDSENVETVRAALGDHETDAPCGSDLFFSGIPAGTHSLLVEAIDHEGFVVMDSAEDANAQQVEILPGASREITVELSSLPARLYLRWSLTIDGFVAACEDAGVATQLFEVEVWDANDNLLLVDTLDCNAPPDEAKGEAYRRIADPDRHLNGDSIVEVDVRPQTAEGTDLGDPLWFTFDPPGRGRELEFTLTCEDNLCSGSGAPDP
jgi:hypothetical protein